MCISNKLNQVLLDWQSGSLLGPKISDIIQFSRRIFGEHLVSATVHDFFWRLTVHEFDSTSFRKRMIPHPVARREDKDGREESCSPCSVPHAHLAVTGASGGQAETQRSSSGGNITAYCLQIFQPHAADTSIKTTLPIPTTPLYIFTSFTLAP